MRFTTRAARVGALMLVAIPAVAISRVGAQDATPAAYSCGDVTTGQVAGTPAGTLQRGMAGMGVASPMAGMDQATMDLDQAYFDMMIPHHQSIVAMAQAALPRLADARLRKIAQTIVQTQSAEIDELTGYRGRFSGEAEPMAMDETTMAAMDELMPGMSGTSGEMAFQMDAEAQVAAVCAAEDADLAFIELTIAHHQMAIAASETAATDATNPEIRDFARRVIDDQQREIGQLEAIHAGLAGNATPAAAGGHHGGEATRAGDAADNGAIRALSLEMVLQIERGEGAGFALAAERNGVPGPRHALDLADELGLSPAQRARLRTVFDAMRADAIPAGRRFLAAQRALEDAFRTGTLSTTELPVRIAEVSRLQGELAAVHLAAHLETAAILSPEQAATYQRLRRDT